MNDDLDGPVRRALADILDCAPPAPHSLHEVAVVRAERRSHRLTVVIGAVAGVAVLGIAGLAIANIDDGGSHPPSAPGPSATLDDVDPVPAVSTTTPVSATASKPPTVKAAPTCGTVLPVDVEVPSAPDGPVDGAADGPVADGQLAQHWELPAGTIEIRWPPDPREIYDLDGTRGDRGAFDSLTLSSGVNSLQVDAAHIDPTAGPSRPTLTITGPAAIGTADWTTTDCSIMQVRYIDLDGNELTLGYNLTDFAGEPAFGVDLNPLIVATENVTTPPVDVAACGTPRGSDVTAAPAPTPAEALLAFLDSGAAPAAPPLARSGYHELHVADGTIVYTWSNPQALVTTIRVESIADGWTVTRFDAAGC